MLPYNLRLAWRSIRRNPILSALMVAAIGVGIGAAMTTLTVYHMADRNPISHRSDVLHHVQLDSYPITPRYEAGAEPADQLSYRDAQNLLADGRGTRRAASFKSAFPLRPDNVEVRPYLALARVTTRDFFAMFDVPFLFGSGWDAEADANGAQVAVLSRETNERIFGGENSVGRTLVAGDREFRIIGVIDSWNPQPKFFDLTNGAFNDAEDFYIPFSLVQPLELSTAGNTNCSGTDAIDGREAFLASECTWITYWVELSGDETPAGYRDYLASYIAAQKQLGRFERESNYRLRNVAEWLEEQEVADDEMKAMVWLALLFLLVCLLNTIGLILAKFLGRAPQVALRRALGASRSALFRQHLAEVLLIGFAGGVLGIGLALLGLRGIRALMDSTDAYLYMDWTMGAAAVGLALVSAAVAGIYPALRIGRIAPARYLKTQ